MSLNDLKSSGGSIHVLIIYKIISNWLNRMYTLCQVCKAMKYLCIMYWTEEDDLLDRRT